MTEHERLESMLAALPDLSSEERAALDAHLETCVSCQDRTWEYGRQDAFLRALALPSPGPALRRGVFDRVEAGVSRRPALLRRRPLLVAPALVTVLTIVLVTVSPQFWGHGAATGPGPAPVLGPAYRSHAPIYDGAAQQARAAATAAAVPASPLIPSGANRSDTISGGIRLSLIAPRGDYPRNALVPVEVEVQNRSPDLVWVHAASFGTCDRTQPAVEAVNARGSPVDPLPGRPLPSCPMDFPARGVPGFLGTGQTMRTWAYVVLLTDRLRARTGVTRFHGCDPRIRITCRGRDTIVLGHPLRFMLRSGHPPRIVLSGLPPFSFHLMPATRPQAPLWYDGWFGCGPAPGQGWGYSEGGVGGGAHQGNGASLPSLAGCSPRNVVLHLVAGYPGRPVAFITERRGNPHP